MIMMAMGMKGQQFNVTCSGLLNTPAPSLRPKQ